MRDGQIALVIGANGGAGFEIARVLLRHGWRVRALARTPQPQRLPGAEWVRGDALDRESVLRAAKGASVIVHAVNPPGYRNWGKLVLPMIDNTIAAAEAEGARIVLPGTIYNYGPDTFPRPREDAPQNALTRKGKIRVELERRLQAATERGARALILRAGDFFGPNCGNSWFAQGLVKPNAPLHGVTYPGKPNVGHAWAYLPDFAETCAQLLDREEALERFARFHFRGHYFARGVDFAERIARVGGADRQRVQGFPWLAVRALAPVVPLFKELAEMRYLWLEDFELDNTKLVALLGAEPHTPTDDAIAATLSSLGCMNDRRLTSFQRLAV